MNTDLFITGTDTDVGKTLVTGALLHAYARQGKKVVGMKPVAAGCEAIPGGLRCGDVVQLQANSNVAAPLNLVNPYSFAPPIAPHIAAVQSGAEIDLDHIVSCFQALRKMADVVLVEGAGGLMVPLNARQDIADLAAMLDLPVILVVGIRLGCINHALLTVQAIRQKNLRLAAWVANQIDPGMQSFDENVQALEARLNVPLLGIVPYLTNVSQDNVSAYFNLDII
ncbi:ATP-dependent dethiobiotin synthetase BioD 1 [mine drainage metagenome]|uniref:ATP-dependent dethiobiotin synthetase BioD 1 n=1 Tax=mine drainage metagenome TaxID=410659 RepID=A0A1J5RA82_9ZZZZ